MRKMMFAFALAIAMTAAMGFGAAAAESGAEQRYVEDRLDRLTLGPSAGATTFPSGTPGIGAALSAPTDLAAYADEVFALVNREREQAGLPLLERSDTLDQAATTRAGECASLNSLYVDGRAHTRPDGSRWFTVLGIDRNYNYGENSGQGKATAEAQMTSWMASDGHSDNILREDYTGIGIACAVSEQGTVFAVQIFYRP